MTTLHTLTDLACLSGSTIYASDANRNACLPDTADLIVQRDAIGVDVACCFVNVEYQGLKGTLLLENPSGSQCSSYDILHEVSIYVCVLLQPNYVQCVAVCSLVLFS